LEEKDVPEVVKKEIAVEPEEFSLETEQAQPLKIEI